MGKEKSRRVTAITQAAKEIDYSGILPQRKEFVKMNNIIYDAIFDAYSQLDFKAAGLFPEDDPAINHNEQVLLAEFGLNKDQELELDDLISTAVSEAHYTSFKNGLIIGAALGRFLHGSDKILQSIAERSDSLA